MWRLAGATLALVLLVTACSDDDGDGAGGDGDAASTTTIAAAAPSGSPGAAQDPECPGIGTVPEHGEVTVVHGNGLFALDAKGERRCLVRGDIGTARWAPTGNRVLYGGRIHYSSGRAPTPAPDLPVEWSRPRGTSLVAKSQAGIEKYPADGGEPVEVPIAGMTVQAFAYHPAGRHVAVAGALGPQYGVYIATNRGDQPRLVTRGETTERIDQLAFSHDGTRLYFVADHGGEQHLHRLDLGDGKLETIATAKNLRDLHVSPIGGLSWRTGECGDDQETHVSRRGRLVELPAAVRDAAVVGWIDAETIIFAQGSCNADDPLRIVRWRPGGDVQGLDSEVYDAQIRMALPEPPGPPPRAVFDLPESAAPA